MNLDSPTVARRFIAATLVVAGLIGLTGTASAQQAPPPSAPVADAAPQAPPPNQALPPPPPPPQNTPPSATPSGAAPTSLGAQPYPPPYPYAYADRKAYDKQYPKELPYDGGEVPPGYRVVEKPRRALTIAGGATFGSLYGISFIGGLSSSATRPLLIPVVGPFTLLQSYGSSGWGPILNLVVNGLLIIDGVGQAAGVGMLIAGIAGKSKKTVLLRNDLQAYKPELLIGPSSVGLRMNF